MNNLRTAAQQALLSLKGYRREINDPTPCDAERALEAALMKAESVEEPVAWRTFDGEGGYYYRDYYGNEDYRDRWIQVNGKKFANWIEPLYLMKDIK